MWSPPKTGEAKEYLLPSPSSLLQITSICLGAVCIHDFTPAFIATPEGMGLLISWLWQPAGLTFTSHRTVANQEAVLNQLSDQGLVQREQEKIPISQSFPENGLTAYFIRWLPEGQGFNLAGISGLAAILPKDKESQKPPFHLLPPVHSNIKPSCQSLPASYLYILLALKLLQLPLED